MKMDDEIDRDTPRVRAYLAEERKKPENIFDFATADAFIKVLMENGGEGIDRRSMGHALLGFSAFANALPVTALLKLPNYAKLFGTILIAEAPTEGFDEVIKGFED